VRGLLRGEAHVGGGEGRQLAGRVGRRLDRRRETPPLLAVASHRQRGVQRLAVGEVLVGSRDAYPGPAAGLVQAEPVRPLRVELTERAGSTPVQRPDPYAATAEQTFTATPTSTTPRGTSSS
jgi:hypothetical protein